MLLVLQPDDWPEGTEDEKHVILTLQPRIPAGSLSFAELPAGMLDDSGTFSGGAEKEIEEETGLKVPAKELINPTELALPKGREKGKSICSGVCIRHRAAVTSLCRCFCGKNGFRGGR